eukprot:scaffold11332_cov26-Cyclotella_meneghiniana.AAC.2
MAARLLLWSCGTAVRDRRRLCSSWLVVVYSMVCALPAALPNPSLGARRRFNTDIASWFDGRRSTTMV